MVSLYPRLWKIVLGLSLCLGLLGAVAIDSTTPLYLAVLLILLVGIPHGAADHRLFQKLYAQTYGSRALLLFYLGYLGLIGFVFLGWYFFPFLTLILFLVLSAYHFGQGNFPYLHSRSLIHHLLYLSWGLWVIAMPVLLHFESALPILKALTQLDIAVPSATVIYSILGTVTGSVLVFLLLIRSEFGQLYWRRELLTLLVLATVFYIAPLFLGFAIYFALWHALPSALDQIRFLFQQDNTRSIRNYLWMVLPFSGLAIGAIVALVMFQPQLNISAYWSWLFAFIAALTLPHMLLLDRVYERLTRQVA